ncbi:MAG: TetR/AcrR family transcriptional regulator [Clostridia bacterium]|nr:TetR/AcrR family transcriptional regulator [Clostridia bacterium]
MKNSADKRVVRTKNAIRNAFASLYSEMPFEDITVTDLARRAGINRKTFYNYYSGVHSIAEEIESELETALDRSLSGKDIFASPETALECLNAIITENLEFCGNIFTSRRNAEHSSRLLVSFARRMRGIAHESSGIKPETLELLTDFITAGLMAAYRGWFLSETRRPLEETTRELSAFLSGGMSAFVENNEKTPAETE